MRKIQTNLQVIGFKGRDKLCVRYFFDGETEDVPRIICRLVNESRPHSCIDDLMKEFPDLVVTVLEKNADEVENWNSDGDEAPQQGSVQQSRLSSPFCVSVLQFPIVKTLRKMHHFISICISIFNFEVFKVGNDSPHLSPNFQFNL